MPHNPVSHRPLRWGILGTAGIVRRNWPAMLQSGAVELIGVASRTKSKAGDFIAEMQATHPWPVPPRAFGGYAELISAPEIEAVYIPLPTGVRKEWVLAAARAGKHVLCEKPCALTAADLEEMIACCREHGVRFMDGVMFMHDPRFAALREILDDGATIGPIRRISSAFTFRAGEDFVAGNIRASALEPAGCLGDLGWYCIRAALWAMDWQMPERATGRTLSTAGDAIMEFEGGLDFAGGATAEFYCSFLTPDRQTLEIAGREGHLRVPDFVVPREDNDVAWEIGYRRAIRDDLPGLLNPARMFAAFAAPGGPWPWPEIALKTQRVQDACLAAARTGAPVAIPG